MLPFLIALQFLTRLPVRLPGMPPPEKTGESLLWYPMVGVLVGTILWLLGSLLGQAAPVLQAAIVLAVWVALTGALHLDGLADTADAWVGGFGDRERTLTIMKDPRSGPMAVVAVIIVLLLKFAALYVLLEHHQLDAVLLVPWLARVALPGLLLVTPYARPGGLGQVLVDHMPKRLLRLVLAAHVIAMLLVIRESLIALLMAVLLFLWLRRAFMTRLGGTTGDTAGALVELLECGVLVALALTST
ncbi:MULTISPECIES: adenosylcobinamide-GDP ribazoletransferase [Pseudomonas]|uniref:Adenosylcobinamide-GDP ribazoletransferase n=1 Tax=Pseudomonas lutea TaxID=243924 RepID=A0A9X8MBF7_9PSED|nr:MULTISPECIES: adenosylcobinamide-GDP ribazoletransferase [Pseudomonas]SEQ23277.1 cobalamin-5'-phosphate synthase [Pseudomonas lutea]